MDARNSNRDWKEGLFRELPMLRWKQEANVDGFAHFIFKRGISNVWEFQGTLTQEVDLPWERQDDYLCIGVDTNQRSIDMDMTFRAKDAVVGLFRVHVEYTVNVPTLAVRATCSVIDEIENRCRQLIGDFTVLNDSSICTTEAMKAKLLEQNFNDIGVAILSITGYSEIIDKPVDVDKPEVMGSPQPLLDESIWMPLVSDGQPAGPPQPESPERVMNDFLNTVNHLRSRAEEVMRDFQLLIDKFKSEEVMRGFHLLIDKFKSELVTKDASIQELKVKVVEVNTELDTTRKIIADLKTKAATHSSQIEQQKFQLQEAHTSRSELSEQMERKVNEVNQLNLELKNVKARSKGIIIILSIVIALLFIGLLVLGSGAIHLVHRP